LVRAGAYALGDRKASASPGRRQTDLARLARFLPRVRPLAFRAGAAPNYARYLCCGKVNTHCGARLVRFALILLLGFIHPSLAQSSWAASEERSTANAHNQGNTYLLADKLPQAILAYKRGLRLNPNHELLRANLEYARSQVNYPPSGRGFPES